MDEPEKEVICQSTVESSDKKPVNSTLCIYICALVEITFFLPLGMITSGINPITPALIRFWNETYVNRYNEEIPLSAVNIILPLVQSANSLGACAGCFLTSYFATRTTRRAFLVIYHIVNILSLILTGPISYVTGSYECMIAGRLINGAGRGVGLALVPVIVAEMTCVEKIALYQSPQGWLLAFGLILGNVVGHQLVLGTDELWPIAIVLPAVFSIYFLTNIPCFPDIPIHLVRQGRPEQAFKALKRLRKSNQISLEAEFERIKKSFSKANAATLTEVFKNPEYRTQLVAVGVVMATTQLVGLIGVIIYSDTVFINVGVPEEYATYATIGLCTLMALTSVTGTFFISKAGTFRLLITGNIIIGVACILLTISTATKDIFPWMAVISAITVGVYMVGNGIGHVLVFFSISAQITTSHTRTAVMAFGSFVLWFTSWLTAFVMRYMLLYLGAYTWLVFFGFTLISTIYFKLYLPKLINSKSKVEIDKVIPDDQNLLKDTDV